MAACFFSLFIADMDANEWGGILGGVLGTVIGIGGGVLGTYFSIKNTKTTAERRFMIRYAVAIWLAVVILIFVPITLSLLGVIPVWAQWAMFGLFYVLLMPSIGWANRRQAALRGAGGENTVPPPQP